MKKNWIRNLIGGLSLTSAMFVFQACYGTPQAFGEDLLVEGQVKSKTSGLPIKGIKVTVADKMQSEYTNDEGRFSLYTELRENLVAKDLLGVMNQKLEIVTSFAEQGLTSARY